MKIKIFLKQNGININAVYDDETTKVTVLKESKIKNNIRESLKTYVKELREKIVNDSNIIENYTFKQDYEFNSLSTAASFCLGYSVNGREHFKLENGKSINTILNDTPDLIEYIKENLYKYQDKKQIGEQERVNFLNRYPLEKLKNLKLEEYDKLGNSTSFMNMIERKTKTVTSGHLGSNVNKLFFHSKKTNNYQMAKVISTNNEGSIEEVFSKYMQIYYQFVNTFNKDNYNAKDYLYGANIIKMNLLLLYKGPIITSIASIDRIKEVLNYLNIKYEEDDDSVGLNIKLTNYLYDKDPSLKKQSLYSINCVLTDYYHKYINNEIKYYLGGFNIGENNYKDYFLKNNLYAIGWDKIGDLNNYDSIEDILDELEKVYPDTTRNHFNQILKYLKDIKIGDKIILKSCFYSKTEQSVTRLFAIGEFTGTFEENYNYIPNVGHSLPVKWLKIYEKPLDIKTAYMKTLQLIKDKSLIKLIQNEESYESTLFDEAPEFNGTNILYYGVPGCGKSYLANEKVKKYYKYERILFHPDYSYSDFIGQIQPKLEKDKIVYQFVPGPFTKILKEALSNPDKEYALIIEEINRGNAPAIFGDIFQLLDRLHEDKEGYKKGDSEYRIQNDLISEYLKDIEYESDEIYIPNNLSLIATMNSSDQNVFVLDTAFKRRWRFSRISNEFEETHQYKEQKIAGANVTWQKFVETINKKITSLNSYGINGEDKQIGKYFMSRYELNDKNIFAEKVLLYLWEDVVKFDRTLLFKEEYTTLDELISGYINYGLKIFKDIFNEEDNG